VRLWSAYIKLSASAMVPRKSTTLSKLLVPSVALYRCSSAELAPQIALVVGSTGAAGAVATAQAKELLQ
jgi:hypothetical protein